MTAMPTNGEDRESGDRVLARDMIEVHGNAAASVARGNASTAVLAGQTARAKSWIRVLTVIQRQARDAPVKER